MKSTAPARKKINNLRLRRVFPRLSIALSAFSVVVALVPFSVRAAEIAAVMTPTAVVYAMWGRAHLGPFWVWFFFAVALLGAAKILSRGLIEKASAAFDSRCVYLITSRGERRIPRSLISSASVRPRLLEITLGLEKSQIWIGFASAESVRTMADELGAAQKKHLWLARRGRPISHWRAGASSNIKPLSTHRNPPHSPDDAKEALLNANAKAETRIGAALALTFALVPDGVDLVRAAAAETQNPSLRAALEGIADASADELNSNQTALIEAALS
ncbi:MAG: hypothetical protein IPK82_05305 [Polyangiaceae bacterium]|nr:hypothetical protein [Polyangiaceae bacterium]